MHVRVLVLFGLALVGAAPPVSATAFFTGLGFAPGATSSIAAAVSADGSTVVGRSGVEAFRWTATEGLVPLERPAGVSARAEDVSGDGSVVVGGMFGPAGGSFRWTAAGGMERIEGFRALGVSRDGAVVVGAGPSDVPGAGAEAYRWSASEGAVRLGFTPGGILYPEEGSFSSQATDVSADGSVVVGYSHQEVNEIWTGFRWTAVGGTVRFGSAINQAVSSDGSILVGQHWNFEHDFGGWWPREATVRFAGSFRPLGLGFLQPYVPGESDRRESSALAVSDEGLVVGWSGGAFLWDELNGMRALKHVLEEEYGLDLTGWHLSSASDITPDGRTIVGDGLNPDGQREAWIAFVPEPGTTGLLALGFATLAAQRRPLTPRRWSPRARAASSRAGA